MSFYDFQSNDIPTNVYDAGNDTINSCNDHKFSVLDEFPAEKKKKQQAKQNDKSKMRGEEAQRRLARKIKNFGICRDFVPELADCSSMCNTKLSNQEIQGIWNDFRGILTLNKRIQYLANLIQIRAAKRIHPVKEGRKPRENVIKYYLKYDEAINNSHYNICKQCFKTIFNLTDTKIRTIVAKKLGSQSKSMPVNGFQYEDSESIIPDIIVKEEPKLEEPEPYEMKSFVCKIDPQAVIVDKKEFMENIPLEIKMENDSIHCDNEFLENESNSSSYHGTIEDASSDAASDDSWKIKKTKKNNAKVKKKRKISNVVQPSASISKRKQNNLKLECEKACELPKCSWDCHVKTTPEERQQVFDEYRQIDDMSRRLQYLAYLIKASPPKRSCVSRENRKKGKTITTYFLKYFDDLDNSKYKMCKHCFMALFCLTDAKIRTILTKKYEQQHMGIDIEYNPGVKKYDIEEIKAEGFKKYNIDRELVPDLPDCHLKCNVKASIVDLQTSWDDYRAITDDEIKTKFLCNLIQLKPPPYFYDDAKINYNRLMRETQIEGFYVKFYEKMDNSRFRVCKKCFMVVFNISRGRVRTLIKAKLKYERQSRFMIKRSQNRKEKQKTMKVESIVVKEEYNFD